MRTIPDTIDLIKNKRIIRILDCYYSMIESLFDVKFTNYEDKGIKDYVVIEYLKKKQRLL